MQFLDEIPYMRLFSANKKIYAPIDPSNRRKGAAIMLLTENPVDSTKLMELPYLYNPGLFTGLYIDRNVNAYINSGAIIDDEVNDPDSAVNEAVMHTVKQKDLEIKLDLHTSSANDVAVLKRILNEKKILKWYKELNCRERYIPFEITVHAYPSVKDLANGANKVALKNKEIATNSYSTFDEIFIVAPSGYNKSLEKSDGKYENYVMNEIITQACMNTSRRCSRFIANSIGTALSGQLNDKFAEKIENDWAGVKDDKIAVAYTISKMYKEEGMKPIRDMVKTGDLYGLTRYASRNFVRRISGVYEATLTAAERKVISDKDYGLPGQKKYPMPDESHVRSAIRFFNHVDPSDEAELARNINKKIKQYGLDVNVGKDNRFSKYYKKGSDKSAKSDSKKKSKNESYLSEDVKEFRDVKDYKGSVAGQKNKKISSLIRNPFESIATTHPEKIDNIKLQAIAASEDIVKSFNDFFDGLYDEMLKIYDKAHEQYGDLNWKKAQQNFNWIVECMNRSVKGLMKAEGISENEAYKIVKSDFMPESLTEAGCRELINIRITKSRAYTMHLRNMIQNNWQMLNLTEAEAKTLIEKLDSGDANLSNEAKAFIKDIMSKRKTLRQFRVKDGVYDFRSVGGGCVFNTAGEEGSGDIYFQGKPQKRLPDIFEYDAIVTSHGGVNRNDNRDDYERAVLNILNNVENVISKESKQDNDIKGQWKYVNNDDRNRILNTVAKQLGKPSNQITYDDITPYVNRYIIAPRKEIYSIIMTFIKNMKEDRANAANHYDDFMDDTSDFRDEHILFGQVYNWWSWSREQIQRISKGWLSSYANYDESSTWGINPVNTLKADNIGNVPRLIRQLKAEGFKKILLTSCNPGSVKLPKDIVEDHSITVYMGNHSVYKENYTEYDEYLDSTTSIMESAIDTLAEIYDIDTYALKPLNALIEEYNALNREYITEGFLDTLKSIAKKAVEIIISIWKKLVEFFKGIFKKVKEFFVGKPKPKEELSKTIETTAITIEGGKAKVVRTKLKSEAEAQKFIANACSTIERAINNASSKETAEIKKIQTAIDQGKVKPNKKDSGDTNQSEKQESALLEAGFSNKDEKAIDDILSSFSDRELEYTGNTKHITSMDPIYKDIRYNNGKPIGFIVVVRRIAGPHGFVILGVDKSARGKGIAKDMATKMLNYMKSSKECQTLTWNVNFDNKVSEKIAKDLGFTFYKKYKTYNEYDYDLRNTDGKLSESMISSEINPQILYEFDWEPDDEIKKSKVYFTKRITPDSLVEIFNALGVEMGEKTAVKISTGEPGKGPRYCLNPQLIQKLVNSVDGTIVECNVAYEGPRHTSEEHWKTIKKHGYYDIAPCDILDEDGDYPIPVENGLVLDHVLGGNHMKNYDSFVVLSHFKGHAMGGYGGALKNVAIGLSSADGKKVVHSGGHVIDRIAGMTDDGGMDSADKPVHDLFLRSMADANKAFGKEMRSKGNPVVYINVANNISVDCDCDPEPHAPTMKDIGIFASLDPVAVDQAAIDAVYAAPDSNDVIERIESRHGLRTIEYAMELGLGSRDYELIDIDKKTKVNISINQESVLNEYHTVEDEYIAFNLDEWKSGTKNNILYITGASASGKSTLSEKIASKEGARWISLDRWFAVAAKGPDYLEDRIKKNNMDEADIYIKYFTNSNKYIKDPSDENEEKEKSLDFLKWIRSNLTNKSERYVVEGIAIYYYTKPEDYIDKPIICMTTGTLTTYFRKFNRFYHKNLDRGSNKLEALRKVFSSVPEQIDHYRKHLPLAKKYREELLDLDESVLQEVKFENDKGEKVPKTCPKCGAKVGVFFRGEPVFLCSNKDCDKYFGTVPFDESTIFEGDGGTKLMSLSKFISVPMTPQNIRFYKDQAKGLSHIRTGDNCKGKIFIENKDGERRVVGFYNTETKSNGEVWLQAIEVMPNYQSQGIGKLLLQDSIKEGAKYLAVAKNNTRAKSMYINHGFKSYERTDKMVFMKLESTILEDSIDDEAKKVANERQGVRYFDFINNISNLFKDIGALTARPRMDPEKGEYEKLRPWLMTLVDKADSMKRIQYLRRDAYTGINQLSTLSKNMKDVKAGTQSRYVNVNYINNLFKKGNSPEKVDAHIKWMKEEYIPYINNRAKEIRKSTNESYDLIPLPVRSINESMNGNGYIYTDDYIMNEDFITFFNGMDDQIITEAEKKYDAKLKNYLFQQRMKNNKAVVMRYQEMKAMSPWIKKTYLKLPMYRGYNIFVDLSYYHGLFLKNLKLTNDNAINMYWDFINRILNDTEYKGIYNKITIFIPVYPGAWDVDNPEDLMNYRKSINPISLIVRMIRHNPGNLKAWGNKDILFVSPKGYFKINFTTFAQKDLAKFKQFIGKLATYDDIADDESEDGYGNKSVDTDSPAAITAKITDKIEKNTGIKLDDITGNGDMDKALPEKVQVDHLRIRTGKFNIPASKIKGDEITDSNTVIIFAPNDDATVEAVKNSALDLKFSFSDKGFYTP